MISTAAGRSPCSFTASVQTANPGIGDFTDLAGLVEVAKQLGADGVGLNPLHVLLHNHPADCSPYSPNSRLFLNPLYIDVEAIPGFPQTYLTRRPCRARLREAIVSLMPIWRR